MKTAKDLKRYKSRMINNPTKEEKEFEQILIKNNIEHKKQLILGFYIIDFVLPDKLIAIEIDGLYHSDEEQIFKDNLRTMFIEKCGFKVIRIDNKDVNNFDIKEIKDSPDYELKQFRKVLSVANVYKGKVIQNNK